MKKERLAVTIDKDLKRRIVEQAKAENRNLSNYVETLLYKVLGTEK